jgi:O-methyltransferase
MKTKFTQYHPASLKAHFTAWLIRKHPQYYMRQKCMGNYRIKDETKFLSLHADLTDSGDGFATLRERYNLWMLARASERLPGVFAEVGVYRGGSAIILAEAKGAVALHLFDTFEGMPATDASHDGPFQPGMFIDTDLAAVKARLAPWSNVMFHPGFFPDSAKDIDPSLRFKLTNIDVDIRSSTLACLDFFYPRTVPGGFLIFHDYNNYTVPGTKAALDEFMKDKPETVLELWDTQALIVKR